MAASPALDHVMIEIPASAAEVGLDPARIPALLAENVQRAYDQVVADFDAADTESDGLHLMPELKRARAAADPEVHRTALMVLTPRRKVTVAAFAIDRTRVTNRQYDAFVRATGHRPPTGWPGGRMPRDEEDFPVVQVSAKDADAYARWAGYDLPSEEEWEVASGGADGRRYPWGNETLPVLEELRKRGRGDYPADDLPELASPFGVLGLIANFWEWTRGPFRPLPGADELAWRRLYTTAKPDWRALRGGFLQRMQWSVWARGGNAPDNAEAAYGFRCVRR